MPYANNNGVKIYYEVEGEGLPLVLAHGFSGALESWRERGYTQELSKDHRLILVDVRGHGASDKPHNVSAYAYSNLVGDIVAVLDHIHIGKTAYFGYSMGGRIGFRIPVFAPERFSALILGGAAYPINGEEDSKDDFLVYIQASLENATTEAHDRPMELHVANLEKRSGRPVPPTRKVVLLANDAMALLASIRAFRNAVNDRPDSFLPRVTIPCLLFAGESDPRYTTLTQCANLIPNVKLFTLPELDHAEAFDRADLVLPHIKEFLAKVSKT